MSKDKVIIHISHRPTPKQRPSYNFQQRRAYTPKKTLDYEKLVSDIARLSMRGKKAFTLETPIKLHAVFVFEVPKSWSKAKKEQALNGEIYPTAKNIGDVDNLLKSCLDGMNGIVYDDDRSIVEINSSKKYGEKDQIIIVVEEV